jgi:tRNA(Ile)-lysidine synthase
MVLLHVLHELARKHHWQLTAAHFNHRLRGRSSDADERLVRRTAEELKVPVLVERADVRAYAQIQKLSLEMAARKLRHDFLARVAAQGCMPDVALAHHADDQLELFFLRLLRGSGGEGLGGMKWRSPSPSKPRIELVRPLLDQPKAVLLAYASEHGIQYREDASNATLDFQRNRIRHELLPLLRRNYQPALDKTISRAIDIIGAEAEFAAQSAKEWLGQRRPGWPSPAFNQLSVAVQRRCVQLQLLKQGIVPDFELVEQLRSAVEQPVSVGWLVRKKASQGTGGTPVLCCAMRDRAGMVRIQTAEAEEFKPSAADVELKGRVGKVEFGGARISWRIELSKAVKLRKAGAGRESFDADRVGSPVRLRHWRPGDRFQPIGMPTPIKLQDFFTNQKVPRGRRRRLIVAATSKGEVFWVEGMRISERFKLTKATIRRLQWRWKRL